MAAAATAVTVASGFSLTMDFVRLCEIAKSIYGKNVKLHPSLDRLKSTIGHWESLLKELEKTPTQSFVTSDLIRSLGVDLRKGTRILALIEKQLGDKRFMSTLKNYFEEFQNNIDTVNEALLSRLAIIAPTLAVDLKKDMVDMKSDLAAVSDGVNGFNDEVNEHSKLMIEQMNQKLDLIIERLSTLERSLQEQRRHEPPAARGSDQSSAKRSKTEVKHGPGGYCGSCGSVIRKTGDWAYTCLTDVGGEIVSVDKCPACAKGTPKNSVATGDMKCGVCGVGTGLSNWVCCCICDKRFHGNCVEMPYETVRIKHFMCLACSKGLGPQNRKCAVCKGVYREEKWVRCGICGNEFHGECVGLAAGEFQFYTMVFDCPTCRGEQ